MGGGKRRHRRSAAATAAAAAAQPVQAAGADSPSRARDDEQLLAAQAARPMGRQGGTERTDTAAMDGLAAVEAESGRGTADAASSASSEASGASAPMDRRGAEVAVEAVGSRSAGASEAGTGAASTAEERHATYAGRMVAVRAASASADPQVAAAPATEETGGEARAAEEGESASRRRGQTRQVRGQEQGFGVVQEEADDEEEGEKEEETEAHWTGDRDRVDRAASPPTVAARAPVGKSTLAPRQEDGPAASTVGVRVLLDGGNERASQRLARGVEIVPKTHSVMSGIRTSHESEGEPKLPPFLEEEEVEDPELGKLLVPKIRTFTLDSTSSSQLDRYINEELHPDMTSSDPNSLHHLRASASPCSSVIGSEGAIPHSKSLVMDDIPPSTVFQAIPTSHLDAVEVVAEQSWLITKLAVQLLWALRMSKRWIMCALRLVWFVFILLPPIFREFVYWLRDPDIHKNIIYGLNARNLLDVYVPPKTVTTPRDRGDLKKPHQYPVVVFFTGGAWIIGYKAWGALMGRVLSCFGVVVVMPDYRNFPQGILPDMVDDATRALQWVFDNVHLFGGDRDNVTLIGQSAGAHIAMCALLEQVERKEQVILSAGGSIQSVGRSSSATWSDPGAMSRTHSCSSNLSLASVESVESALSRPPTWELRQIRSFIGISGPYNMEASLATFHRHGFDKGVVERIMAHRLAYYSPSLRLLAKSELRDYSHALDDFPPVYLFHGTADKTVQWQSTEQLARALEACRIPVKTRFFDGKTHTDPIIEDPICGDDFLLDEIVAIMKERSPVDPRTGRAALAFGELSPEKRYYPSVLVTFARRINPF